MFTHIKKKHSQRLWIKRNFKCFVSRKNFIQTHKFLKTYRYMCMCLYKLFVEAGEHSGHTSAQEPGRTLFANSETTGLSFASFRLEFPVRVWKVGSSHEAWEGRRSS